MKAEASAAVAEEEFAGAMSAMAKLRPAVDAFFDKVKVNDDDAKVRENRLKLLNEIRAATRAVADFSRFRNLTGLTPMDRSTLAAYDKDAASFAEGMA